MTDGWERPDRPTPPAVEIPLTGDGPLVVPTDDDDSTPPPNWRKVIGLASLGGVLGGIALSVVLMAFVFDDDEPGGGIAGDPTSTLDQADRTTLITTPATLIPLDTVAALADAPRSSASPGAPARAGSLLDQIVVPTFPPATAREEFPPASFDLDTAVLQLGTDLARSSSTKLELGVGGFIRNYSIVRDPVSDRYEFVAEGLVSVVDRATGLTYLDISSPGDPQWVLNDNQLVAENFGVENVGVLYDRLLLGPIRPDTISSATVTPGQFVMLDDGITVARVFTVELPGDLIPEWQLYVFGPTHEFLPSDRPSRMAYTVYVDEHSEIRRVVGLSDLGGIPQLVVHDLGALAERFPIELPDPATINTGPPRFGD